MLKHTIRTKEGNTKEVTLNLGRAVRAMCLECLGWSPDEVKKCSDPLCPLHPFRFGKDPSKKRDLTDEQREAMAIMFKERLNNR